MKHIFNRLFKRLKSTSDKFANDSKFSLKLAILRVADECGNRLGFVHLSQKAHEAKDTYIHTYLKNSLSDVIEKNTNNCNLGSYTANTPIWVCWWTGEDTAPPIVQLCIKSIRAHANGHPVYFVDQTNYKNYLDIPNYILEKVNRGSMCLANFSDYIRVSLIDKYGGLWLDSTVFCSKMLPNEYFDVPFFSCKSKENECGYISKMRWTSFIMGGYQSNAVTNFMKNAFEKYWQLHETSIDYLLVDYLINLAYEEIPHIRALIDQIPINNIHRDDLQNAMNDRLPAKEFNNILKNDTVLYKLSWRESYFLDTINSEESVYSYFLKL